VSVTLDLPLETARVRLRLARVVACDQTQVAITEAGSALAVFERLGAAADAGAPPAQPHRGSTSHVGYGRPSPHSPQIAPGTG
jgi:hypothetical protein